MIHIDKKSGEGFIHIEGKGKELLVEFTEIGRTLVEHGVSTFEVLHDLLNIAESEEDTEAENATENEAEDTEAIIDAMLKKINELRAEIVNCNEMIKDLMTK